MNTSWQSLKIVRTIFLLPALLTLLTGCTTHVYNERVVIEDHTQPFQEQSMTEDAGFPDPVLRDNLFEAKEISESIYDEGDMHRLSSGVHICFPRLQEC